MDNKTILMWGIIIGIIFSGLLVLGYLYYNDIYQQGYNQGTNDLIIKINTDGKIPVIYFNNQTGNSTVNYIPIQQICLGSGK